MFNSKAQLISLLTLLGIVTIPSTALAGPYLGVAGAPGDQDHVLFPPEVPGKEYSNDSDRNGHPNQNNPIPDPTGQVVDWDANPFVPWGTRNGNKLGTGEIDALANKQDVLFNEVVNNLVPLLFSTGISTGISGDEEVFDNFIFYEKASGEMDVWAEPEEPTIKVPYVIDQIPPDNVDALEVWAPSNPLDLLEDRVNQGIGINEFQADTVDNGDANRYSNIGDPGGISLFDSNGTGLITTAQIATAIDGLFPNFTISNNQIDLDGLMFSETLGILFSVAPIDGNGDGSITNNDPTQDVDGGEIFFWDTVVSTASFLDHGGHTWNTEFSVQDTVEMQTGLRPGSENIDALEAVATTPESSSTIGILALGIIGGGATLKRKLKSANSTEK